LCCPLFCANSGRQRRTEVALSKRHRMDRAARIVAGKGKDMTDREMLELAAKAAGIELKWHRSHAEAYARNDEEYWAVWNPLADDKDALRLAVKLGMDVMHTNIHSPQVHAMAAVKVHVWEDRTDDPYAATRRAIVRAAAAIGRNMT